MYIGRARLSVYVSACLSVPGRMPTLLHGPDVTLGNGRGAPWLFTFGRFAVGARVSLIWQHRHQVRNVSEDASTRCTAGQGWS